MMDTTKAPVGFDEMSRYLDELEEYINAVEESGRDGSG